MVQVTSEKPNITPRRFLYGNNSNKKRSRKRFCMKKFVEFCKRTDLHGYKYIVMKDFNYGERCCWAVAVLISVAIAAYFVVTAYRWYARNPIVTVIESTQGAIWDVPFPAVTICDLNIVSRRAARTLANNLTLPENVTADFVFDTFRLVPLLYSTFTAEADEKKDLWTLQTVLDLNNISIDALFLKLSPASSCSNLVQRCMWKNAIYRCEDMFKQIFTLLSLCCTFNYYAIDDDFKTHKEDPVLANPRRVASCGYQTALTVLLYTNSEDYYSASIASQGALVIIDNAYNIPDLDSPVRMVNPSTELLIALSPERTYTTSGIRSFSPEQRQCYYNDEKIAGSVPPALFLPFGNFPGDGTSLIRLVRVFINSLCVVQSEPGCEVNDRTLHCVRFMMLKYFTNRAQRESTNYASLLLYCYDVKVKVGKFRQYSFHNCMAYQKVQWLKKACGCIPLSFPREESYRICNFKDMDCLDTIFNEEENRNITKEKRNYLPCFPECEHYDYPLEVALGNLADNIFVNGLPFFDKFIVEGIPLHIIVKGKTYTLIGAIEFVPALSEVPMGNDPCQLHRAQMSLHYGYDDVNVKNRSLLNVFFNDLVSTRYRRDVYLNWQNILAAFGGLLSLMLGFTLISGFDLVLFFTIRVAYDACTNAAGKQQNKIYVNEYNTKKRWMDNAIINPKTLEKYKIDYFEHRRY